MAAVYVDLMFCYFLVVSDDMPRMANWCARENSSFAFSYSLDIHFCNLQSEEEMTYKMKSIYLSKNMHGQCTLGGKNYEL